MKYFMIFALCFLAADAFINAPGMNEYRNKYGPPNPCGPQLEKRSETTLDEADLDDVAFEKRQAGRRNRAKRSAMM